MSEELRVEERNRENMGKTEKEKIVITRSGFVFICESRTSVLRSFNPDQDRTFKKKYESDLRRNLFTLHII